MKSIKEIIFEEETPKYIQIANKFKKLIEDGSILDGEKLPTIRELSTDLNVNKITAINCYKKLKNEGFAYQKVGSGTFAKKKEMISPFRKDYSKTFKLLKNDDVSKYVDFTGETTKEILFPIKDFKEIINTVLDRDGEEVLLSQNTLGYDPLRETINNVFWDGTVNTEDILIVSGAQQGIDIASKALLNINDNVIVEKPTYGGALSVFKWRRANIFEVPIEEDGINIEKFEKVLKKNKITLFYAMSYFQNPTGVSYSLEKKKRILELAKEHDFYIIEDDYLSELIYEEDFNYIPFKYLDKENRVIYIKSFSKIFIPGIRLGYIIVPEKFRENFLRTKFNTDITTSTLMQRALEYYIANKNWKENVHNLSVEYKKRYNLMGKIIKEELSDYVYYNKPNGGLNYYLEIKDSRISSRELFYRLKKNHVYITPGVLFFRTNEEGDRSFRIGFSQTDCDNIIKGLRIIKEEFKSWHI
ncbi:PLP-dependent aminotransferase family protein [Clostridium sardiniense]|uniref:PLP-dependent aminotransferase family protein n=1 Tax=Clostridium sardiniense TaxID=29369 RepID=A0ABS7KX23_CLOSR|nr:PLP-dependent aminotransferase family protein [Clostridium sardiniense]MBY0755137.1 PLP-dependent aminotransferase family protein [Clostridium sardiniense]MDQ0458999.1 DNA-binding transcriptional MocR family regulator [Clostridium sardiniense]